MNTPVSQIDNAFQDIFDAYAYVKSSIVFEALLAIIAGIILTTLVFKLTGIVKDMLSEGKDLMRSISLNLERNIWP